MPRKGSFNSYILPPSLCWTDSLTCDVSHRGSKLRPCDLVARGHLEWCHLCIPCVIFYFTAKLAHVDPDVLEVSQDHCAQIKAIAQPALNCPALVQHTLWDSTVTTAFTSTELCCSYVNETSSLVGLVTYHASSLGNIQFHRLPKRWSRRPKEVPCNRADAPSSEMIESCTCLVLCKR